MKKVKVCVVGATTTDILIQVPELPNLGETVLGEDYIMSYGGKGANQALAALRLGCDVTFISRVGNDYFGQLQLLHLEQEGLSTKFISRDKIAQSALAVVFVDQLGDNVISVAPGANMKLTLEDVQSAKNEISNSDVLLVQLSISQDAVYEAISIAQQSGTKIIMNPSPARYFDMKYLGLADILTPNKGELAYITSSSLDSKDAIIAAGKKLLTGKNTIVTTLGSEGAIIINKQESITVSAFNVISIDSTGAGDAFNGCLAAVLNRMPLIDAVRFSCAAGALATTKVGAQTALPHKWEIAKYLSENTNI